MTEETLTAPVAAVEIPATEATAQDNPEVAAPENDEAAERDDPTKVVKRMERRIDRLTAARYQAEARAEQAAAENAQLRARYSQENPQENQQQDPVALAREISHVERITEKANGIAADGNKRFTAFGKAVATVSAEVGALFDRSGKATPIGEAILAADDPAALIHHIGSNPDLAADLADLTPIQQARKLARIEIDMAKPRDTKQSQAPKPITPARAIARDSGGLSDDLDINEWAKRFNKQRRGV